MSALDVARWQFAITTVYHFIFVPLTIGLSVLVAVMQTVWYVRKDRLYLRMTRFFGTLFLINFAMGVVTGIVQEFQFGMNWSDYLWFFGWDRLSPRLHLATIWLAASGTNLSAYFILAANSWMQHPVGYRINPVTHRAELTSISRLLTNSTALVTYPHVLAGAFLTAGIFLVGVSSWHLLRRRDVDLFRRAMRLGLVVSLVAAVVTVISGDLQARFMTKQQPMKLAAAEALYSTSTPASYSLFTIGSLDGGQEIWSVRVPHVLSFMATGGPDGKVEGIGDVQRSYARKYGAGGYKPEVPVTYR